MLVECSLLNEEETSILQDRVDYFIKTYEDDNVRHACLESHKKGFGEVKKLEKACEYIQQHGIIFQRLFKISGRYFLNESFTKENYSTDLFTFKMYGPDSGSTVLYSVPFSLFSNYCSYLKSCIQLYNIHFAIGLETLIPIMCVPRQEINNLGLSGHVAVLNDQGISDFYTA